MSCANKGRSHLSNVKNLLHRAFFETREKIRDGGVMLLHGRPKILPDRQSSIPVCNERTADKQREENEQEEEEH